MKDFLQWSVKLNPRLQTKKSGELFNKVFSLKELFNCPNYPATGSTKAQLPPLPYSPLLEILLNEGAIFAGKVHTHEIAFGLVGWNPIAGQALNPHDPERISGGSSSGSAISVASGECDFSLGTDTGGSIRTPAAFCGVLGFKPTTGRISTVGILQLSKTLDHVGIMARELPLITKVFNLLSNQSDNPNSTRKSHKRIGLWDVQDWVQPSIWQTLMKFADKFIEAGYEIERFSFGADTELYSNICRTEATAYHKEALSEENPKFGEITLDLLRIGQTVSNETYQEALAERLRLQQQVSELFERYDYLLAPTVPCVAPKLDTQSINVPEGEIPLRQSVLRLTSPWSLVGVPTLSIPLPLDGLFVGAQIIGPHGADEDLLEFAENLF